MYRNVSLASLYCPFHQSGLASVSIRSPLSTLVIRKAPVPAGLLKNPGSFAALAGSMHVMVIVDRSEPKGDFVLMTAV